MGEQVEMELLQVEFLFEIFFGVISELDNMQLANHVGGRLAWVALVTGDFLLCAIACVPGVIREVLEGFGSIKALVVQTGVYDKTEGTPNLMQSKWHLLDYEYQVIAVVCHKTLYEKQKTLNNNVLSVFKLKFDFHSVIFTVRNKLLIRSLRELDQFIYSPLSSIYFSVPA